VQTRIGSGSNSGIIRENTNAIHIIGKVGRTSFGLGAVALNLVQQQNLQGWNSLIWCLEQPEEVDRAIQSAGLDASRIHRFNQSRFGFLGYTPEMERAVHLASGANRPAIVHQHSIWSGLSRVTHEWRKRHNVRTIVAAHGCLQKWALSKSMWKKKIALMAYEAENLHRASCLHACGESEVVDYREYGLKNPIALIPNGISEAWIHTAGDEAAFRKRYALPHETRIMLYVSRITPKKGLRMVLDALRELRREFQDWTFVIAGVDEFNHQRELETLVQTSNLNGKIRFIGPLYGDEKRNAYAAAELFILPTHSEGNPISVLEALGAGRAVITTKGTPWGELICHNCGWWTDVSSHAIGEALAKAVSRSKSDLTAMGRRGLELVRGSYTWPEITKKTIQVYDWLNERGRQPECVYIS
jgi:glycosyltransferase involved in cell wall biosynthesis